MAQERIEIQFKPKGDKALINAIKQLDIVTKRLKGTTSIYEKEVKELERAQRKLNKQIGKTNKGSPLGIKNNRLLSNSFATLRSKMLLVSFGLGLLTMGFKKLFEATIEQEKVEKKLEHQLGRVSKGLLNYASGLQAVTKFGDEAIIGVQGMLAAFTKDEEQIKLATQATLDLAEAKGMDLKTAGDLVSKTLGSSTNALSRYGIEVTGSANSILRLESLTRNISTLFAGEATSAANTFGGQITQMTNSVGDANEAIGNYLQPIMKRIAGFIKDAADATKEFFNRLNESELETIVRRFEEMGVSAKEIAGIKNFMLADELDKINEKLEDTGTGFKTVQEVRDAISNQGKNLVTDAEKMNNVVEDRGNKERMLIALQKSYNKALEDGLDPAKDHNKMIEVYNEKTGKTLKTTLAEVEARILNTQNVLKQDTAVKNITNSTGKALDNAIKEGDSLAVILQLLLERDRIQQQITSTGEDDPIFKLTIEDIQNYTEQYGAAIMNVANQYIALQQAQLNAAKQTELSATSDIKWEKKKQKEIEKINKKYEKEQQKLNQESKRAKRAQTVINTAVSLMEVWSDDTIKLPGKIIMSAFVTALGAMQLKTIDAQKYATGGMVGGNRHSQGGTMIEAERGEYVISRQGVEAAGIEALNRINAGAGAGSVNISFNGNVLSKDFIEDEAIPQIKEAIRRGADIGVG